LRFYIFDHNVLSDSFVAWAELPVTHFTKEPYVAQDMQLK